MRLTTHYHHTRYEENGSEGKFSLRMPRRKSSVFKPPVLIQFQVTADSLTKASVRQHRNIRLAAPSRLVFQGTVPLDPTGSPTAYGTRRERHPLCRLAGGHQR